MRWLVFDQTQSEFMLGVVEVASLMPGLLVGLVAGALADRVAPLRMIGLMECGQMVLAFLLAMLVGLDIVQIWQMAVILALTRICVTFELPSRQVFFYELVGPEIGAHSRAESFADGRLVVRTDSTQWATELRLLAPTVVRRLNEDLGHGTVVMIEVLGPHAPSWKHGSRSVRGGRGPRDTYG